MQQIKRVGDKTISSELKHRITIQELSVLADGEGGFIESWDDVETVFAAVYPISAKQVFEYRSVGVDATHIIKVRGDIDISTTE